MSTLPVDVLEQLLALARRLTSRRDLDSVLKDLMDGSLRLIPGSDFACVFLYDVEENLLYPVGGVGFEMRYMQHVHLKPGESLTGQAFLKKEPLLLPTPEDVRRAQQNLLPHNDRWVRLAVGRPTNPLRSSLAVPLCVGDRTVGVLVIDNYDTDRNFTEIDLRIAVALADHAAIAVANAQDYQLANALSRELKQTLTVQHRLLGSILAPSSSFQDILHTLGGVIHRPVAVWDGDKNMVSQSGAMSEGPKVFPIRTGASLLGYLGVGGRPLSRAETSAVEQAVPLVALEFMKRAAVEREQNRVRADLLYRLLDNDRAALQDAEHCFGLGGQEWQAVVIGRESTRAMADLVQILGPDRTFSAAVEEARVWVIRQADKPRVSQWLAAHGGAVAVWGHPSLGIEPLAEQLRGVLSLWRLIERDPLFDRVESVAFDLREFPELALLHAVPVPARHHFVARLLGPVESDPQSLETLKAWVFANRSFRRAAALLHTHPNTVRYRISRIAELLDRNLDDDHIVGLLWLALLWHEPLDAAPALDAKTNI